MRSFNFLRSSLKIVLGLGVSLALVTGAWAQSFNDAQKSELGEHYP